MWEALRPRLVSLGLDPCRVENAVGVGVPDTNYLSGWMELKDVPAWPKREDRPLMIPSLVEKSGRDQVAWMFRRWSAGGPAWLMLRVGRELLLFSAFDAPTVRVGRTKAELRRLAVWRTNSHGEWAPELGAALKAWLTWDLPALPPPSQARLMRLKCMKTVSETAADMGWHTSSVEYGEHPDAAGSMANDLIDYWLA